jgi:CheY-like chemotaxis protein
LVVEDSADDVVLLQHAFQRAGLSSHLSVVSDGIEAMAYLCGEDVFADRFAYPFPDFILLDINMPRKNGFELLEWLRADANCCRIMVHVLTASSREADVERAYELHANSYTVKPSRLDELTAFVVALHQWHEFLTLPRPVPEEKCTASPE